MIKCYWNDVEVGFKPFKYPAGELGYKIDAAPSKIVCWFQNSDDIILTAMLVEHFPQVELVIPYMPCAREDRRVNDSSSYGFKLIQYLFDDGIAKTYDAHNPDAFRYTELLKPDEQIRKVLAELQASNPDHIFSLVFPDAGAKDKYNIPGHPIMYGEKVRDTMTGDIIDYKLVEADFHGKNVLVIDDICDGGRTFIEVAKRLPVDANIYLWVSHGIFSQGFEELKKYYKHIYTTDSYLGQRDPDFVTEYQAIEGVSPRGN
jgi:ribose-phosphate pyrophosphokinase